MECNHVEHGDMLVDRALLNSFIDLHRSQFQLSGVPQVFYPTLFHKLQNQVNSFKEKLFLLIGFFCNKRSLMPVNILVLLK
jgi:hypothetical protein